MRILFDHQSFSLQITGGITRYFYQLVKYFNQAEDVSTTTQLGYCTTVWPLEEASKPNGSVLHWGKRPVKSGMGTYFINEALLNPYNVLQPQVDIYHNTLYRFMPGVKAKRYVATHHDCTVERYPQMFKEAKIVMASKRRMLKQADLVFSVSGSSRNDLLEFYDYDPARVIVLTHPPAPLPRSPGAADELKRLVSRPFLLYVGTRVPYKNFGGLIKGFAVSGLQTQCDLLVIGGGPFSADERAEIAGLGLADAVVPVPLASGGLLAEAYATARAFVYPGIYEGLGLPPLEAMEKGCPVLVSSNPACVEVCKDGALFFDPFDIEDLSVKLRMIAEDSEENRVRVQRGYQVRELYHWQPVIDRMLAAYRAML